MIVIRFLFALVILFGQPLLSCAQHSARGASRATPKAAKGKLDKEPKIEEDEFTLRYKPQVGTVLYDIQTTVIHDREHGKIKFPIHSTGQIAFKNESIDINANTWTFYRYFTNLSTRVLLPNGIDTTIREVGIIGKRTKLTFTMTGEQMLRNVEDSGRFISPEAQVHAHYFQAPRLLDPLPPNKIKIGYIWQDHQSDSVIFRDSVTSLDGAFYYDVDRIFEFVGLVDTLGATLAHIKILDKGTFRGHQNNFNIRFDLFGPMTSEEHSYLNLRSGLVVARSNITRIPIDIERDGRKVSDEVLRIEGSVHLNSSNTLRTR